MKAQKAMRAGRLILVAIAALFTNAAAPVLRAQAPPAQQPVTAKDAKEYDAAEKLFR